MTVQLAALRLADRRIVHEALLAARGNEEHQDCGGAGAVRGIATAVLISAPVWGVIVLALNLLSQPLPQLL